MHYPEPNQLREDETDNLGGAEEENIEIQCIGLYGQSNMNCKKLN